MDRSRTTSVLAIPLAIKLLHPQRLPTSARCAKGQERFWLDIIQPPHILQAWLLLGQDLNHAGPAVVLGLCGGNVKERKIKKPKSLSMASKFSTCAIFRGPFAGQAIDVFLINKKTGFLIGLSEFHGWLQVKCSNVGRFGPA